MRRGMRLLAIALLTATAGAPIVSAAHSAPPVPPPVPDLTPWLPSESWPGGRQFDPRLDETVSLWGAGIPLRNVFARAREQTGVEIGFFPAGDDNERICVTLYLNPENPPTLRDLMAQLSWVTDCAFALRPTADGAAPTYYLLSTSIAQGVAERLRDEQILAAQSRRAEQERRKAEHLRNLPAKLEEHRSALALSDEELIARYKDVDDSLLLNMLDPARRAQIKLVLNLPEDDKRAFLSGEKISRPWAEWSPEQQQALKTVFGPSADYWGYIRSERRNREGFGPPAEWLDEACPLILLEDSGQGQIQMGAMIFLTENPRSDADVKPAILPTVRLTQGTGLHSPEEAIVLEHLLSGPLTETQEEVIFGRFEQARSERAAERERQQQQAFILQHVGPQGDLSPEVEAALSSAELPLERDSCCALWQIQEAVAARTGLHIVSDCFWQPERWLEGYREVLYPDGPQELTALRALLLSTAPQAPRHMLRWQAEEDALGWEWGQAGSFLRFRTTSRDVWRASLLPAETLDLLGQWLSPYAEDTLASDPAPREIAVAIDLSKASPIAAPTDDFQARLGGLPFYGDPADEREVFAQAFRSQIMTTIAGHRSTLCALATLTDGQWHRLRGEGLRWGYDLAPEQQSTIFRMVVRHIARFQKGSRDALLRFGPVSPDWPHDSELRLWLGEELLYSERITNTVVVQFKRPQRLVDIEVPQEGM